MAFSPRINAATPARADHRANSVDSAVVLLDGEDTYRRFADRDMEIYWGAYLGTPDEILISGRLKDVADEIHRRRAEARQKNGWIMDTYLLRRR